MAKKEAKQEAGKTLERTYVIPLSRELLKVPYYRKAKKAGRVVRAFLEKHMKSDDVKIGRLLNMKLWENGIKNPPKNIKVTAVKDASGTVKAELFGAVEKVRESKIKPKAGEKKEEDAATKALEAKLEQKDEKAEKAAETEKEDIKELKKEMPKMHHHEPKMQPKEHPRQDVHPRAPKSV
jgi:large subunit ribosomal protein L31e